LENKLNKNTMEKYGHVPPIINVGPNMANIGCMVRKAVLITKP
jgi:hypothetical protein